MSATVLAVLTLAFDESSSHGFLTGKASAFPSANVSPVSSTMTACTCDQSNYGRVDGPLNRTATYLDDRTKHTALGGCNLSRPNLSRHRAAAMRHGRHAIAFMASHSPSISLPRQIRGNSDYQSYRHRAITCAEHIEP